MKFLHPEFAWGFAALGLIVFFYLLKRRYLEKDVPSTFLWRRAMMDPTANRPIQRLRRNVLLPLQLLMAAVLALALMGPVLAGAMGGEWVMIFDLSASMQARQGERTRLQDAVRAAEEVIAALGPRDAVTILACDGRVRQVLNRSTDREAARRALSSLEPGNQDASVAQAVSLAKAMARQIDGVNILVFSDAYVPEAGVSARNAAAGLENRAVQSFAMQGNTGFARVVNYGGDCRVTLACYAQGALCDAQEMQIAAGEASVASFQLPDCDWAYVEIQQADAIAADNRLYAVAGAPGQYQLALCGDENLFLEQALTLREDISLLRVPDGNLEGVEADLYVYGNSPLIFSLQKQQTQIQAGAQAQPRGEMAVVAQDVLTQGLSLRDVAVRAYRPLTGGRALVALDGACVVAATQQSVALGFDIHDTNLPMKYDFPILVQNILNLLLPPAGIDTGSGTCGAQVQLRLPADGERAWVRLPSGESVPVEDAPGEGGAYSFEDTARPGLYALCVEGGRSAGERYFALRMPLSESDVRSVAPSVDAGGAALALEGGGELGTALLGLFLLLLLVEWGVRSRVD